MLRFALTIFLSAFLLFQVQPLIAKFILPWFGGTSGVWTTCMLFFQMVLLLGYAYAHWLGRFPWKKQAAVHLVLLAVALVFMPIVPSANWRPTDGDMPTLRILLLLAATLGVPYMLLSSTGPLLQNWFSATFPGRSPYRLYSLSNVGSLLALITFPIWVETNLSRHAQVYMWSGTFGAFALACGWCAMSMLRRDETKTIEGVQTLDPDPAHPATEITFQRQGERPGFATILMWLLLSASGSAMLLATTNQLTAEVAVVPFLWIIPLSLYLITFIICFDNERWYNRTLFGSLLLITTPIVIYLLHEGVSADLWLQIVGYSACMFAVCMTCHGELVKSKPHPQYLTLFYLLISAGGALGGLFVAVVAPMTFSGYFEYHIALFVGVLMTVVAWMRAVATAPRPMRVSILPYGFAVVAGMAAVLLTLHAVEQSLNIWPWEHPVVFLADVWTQIRTTPSTILSATLGVVGLVMLASVGDRFRANWGAKPVFGMGMIGLLPIALGGALIYHLNEADRESIYTIRNFYGVLHVEKTNSYLITTVNELGEEVDEDLGPQHKLVHGRIMHGHQFIKDAPQRRWHTSYYGRKSGVGVAIEEHPRRNDPDPANRSMHIGCIGLGTGTLSSYGRPGDKVRIYEINPAVEDIARKWFYYLGDAGKHADVKVVLGDARVMLERELERGEVQHFDVLAVDAFSSDSIPVHLLTKECTEMYFKHIKPDGVLALHISNRFIDLEPVTFALGREFGCEIIYISNSNDYDLGVSSSTWVLLTRNKAFAASANAHVDAEPWKNMKEVTEAYLETIRTAKIANVNVNVGDPNPEYVKNIIWTDDFANLWQLLDF